MRTRIDPDTAEQMLAKRKHNYSVAWIAAFYGVSRAETQRVILAARARKTSQALWGQRG